MDQFGRLAVAFAMGAVMAADAVSSARLLRQAFDDFLHLLHVAGDRLQSRNLVMPVGWLAMPLQLRQSPVAVGVATPRGLGQVEPLR